jgi:hypothetical protein
MRHSQHVLLSSPAVQSLKAKGKAIEGYYGNMSAQVAGWTYLWSIHCVSSALDDLRCHILGRATHCAHGISTLLGQPKVGNLDLTTAQTTHA